MTLPLLPQNIAVSQLEQPVPLLPWMNAPHPPTRGVVVLGLISMAIFIGGFSAWSFFAPLAEAAIAEGVISVEGQHRVIANQEGGSVQELLVHDGDHVRAGQVLIRMNDAQASATAETAKAQRWTFLAQLARIDQQLAVISSAEQQQRATQQQIDLIQREVDVKQTLLSKGLARLSEVLQLQRSEAALYGTSGDLAGQIERARATIAESRSSIKQTRDQRLQDVSDDRRDARSKLNETEDNLRAAQDVAVRRDLVAPEDGTILSMRVFNVGAVVKPGDTVMELVPSQDRLVAQVNLAPNDIDVVYPGLNALIRLPAFKQRLVPFLSGRVIFVASDVTTDEKTKTDYYKTQILVDRDQLDHLPNVHLTPGMPVEAMVQLGERSFFHYITQPIRDSFHRAFTDQ